MINDYKKAFKLMTLSPKFKMQIILASIFFILGIVLDIASTGATVTGGVYIFIPAISMMELFYGANESAPEYYMWIKETCLNCRSLGGDDIKPEGWDDLF